MENAGSLADKAKRAVLEADKMEAELTLTKIDKLEKKSMREISKSDGSTISSVREEIEVLAKKIDPSLVKDDVAFSSSGLSFLFVFWCRRAGTWSPHLPADEKQQVGQETHRETTKINTNCNILLENPLPQMLGT